MEKDFEQKLEQKIEELQKELNALKNKDDGKEFTDEELDMLFIYTLIVREFPDDFVRNHRNVFFKVFATFMAAWGDVELREALDERRPKYRNFLNEHGVH